MTHDILQSDITLATKLFGEHRPDEEILQALASRGVDPAQAARLLDDLRSGRKPEPASPLPAEMTTPRRSRSRSAGRDAGRESPSSAAEAEPARKPRPQPTSSRRRNAATNRVAVAALIIVVVAAAGIVLLKLSRSGSNVTDEPRTKMASTQRPGRRPPASGTAAGVAGEGARAPLVLELQPEGLRIGGSLITGDNLLTTVASLLGAPTRTNQAATAGTIMYAYDLHGLLIYSQPDGRTNHIVLDCEATGGLNGTTSPFTGTIRVEDQMIGPDTDSQALVRIKKLEWVSPKSGGTIWGGTYNNLGLVFAYLKSPRHPSLIEIDLR